MTKSLSWKTLVSVGKVGVSHDFDQTFSHYNRKI